MDPNNQPQGPTDFNPQQQPAQPAPEQAPGYPQPPLPQQQPTQPFQQQPAGPQQPYGPAPQGQPVASDPGQTFGILSLVMIPLGLTIVGIVLGVLGKKKSQAAGFSGQLSKIGLIANIVISVLAALIIVVSLILVVAAGSSVVKQCNDLGSGTHQTSSGTITCGSDSSSPSSGSSSGSTLPATQEN